MRNLNITWDDAMDPTGYLFSLAKSLSTAVQCSPWADRAEDIIATSGFAFRMWVTKDLCPSATSIWSFDDQKRWTENGGLTCDYVGRYWEQDDAEERMRLKALGVIRKSVDDGVPVVSWDIGVPEWGLITGYDDEAQQLTTLAINGAATMAYDQLGKREIPILSVLAVTGVNEKSPELILRDTKKLAAAHLRGEEWCPNACGLAAYPALIAHLGDDYNADVSWNLEYYIGTFAALKYYAWKYFDKMGDKALASAYKAISDAWMEAFKIKKTEDLSPKEPRKKIADLLLSAQENETKAAELMEQ